MGINVKSTQCGNDENFMDKSLSESSKKIDLLSVNDKQCWACYWVRCEENALTVVTYAVVIMIIVIIFIVLASILAKRKRG